MDQENEEVNFEAVLEMLKPNIGMQKPFPLFLISDITEANFSAFMIQLAQAEHNFKEQGDPFRDIVVKLTSTGGNIGLGFAMYDIMKASPLKFIVETYGYCCSAAMLPLMGADYRVASKHCQFLLHEAFMSTEEPMSMNKKNLMDHHKELDYLFNNYCKVIAKRSKQPVKLIKRLCSEEATLSAKEALELNLIDKIL